MGMTWRVCAQFPTMLNGVENLVWWGVYPDGGRAQDHIIGCHYETEEMYRDPFDWWKGPMYEDNPWEIRMSQFRYSFIRNLLGMDSDDSCLHIQNADLPVFIENIENVLSSIRVAPGLAHVPASESGGHGTGQMQMIHCGFREERNVADLEQLLVMAKAAYESGLAIDAV